MNNTNCKCGIDCTFIAVGISIIVGIITVFLTFNAVITVTPVFYWVVFGIANLYLILSYYLNNRGYVNSCSCNSFGVVITGALGSVAAALVLLAVGFAATSIIGAIITGLLLFFFTLLITSILCFGKCTCYGE